MKVMKKLTALLLCVMMILSSIAYIPAFAEEEEAVLYTDTDPNWIEKADKEPVTDYAYSICVVGDTQIVSHYQPEHLATIYDWILENKDEKKIEFVVGVGDIGDSWDEDDANGNGIWDSHEELLAAREQIFKLNGVIPYTLARGNHDSYNEYNTFFNVPEYADQLDGFYEKGSVENTYKTVEINGEDFLFITLDYGPTDHELEWACGVVEAHPNHKVVVSTHAYMFKDGTTQDKNDYPAPGHNSNGTINEDGLTDGYVNNGEDIWNEFVSKYENIFLVLSGHISSDTVIARQDVGVHGNVVTQMLIDQQGLDKYFYDNGCEGTGMVTMLYFSEDGETMAVEQFSTIHDKFYRADSQFNVNLNGYGDYVYRYDFDEVIAGTEMQYISTSTKTSASAISNPYGLDTTVTNTNYGTFPGTIMSHGDGSGNYMNVRRVDGKTSGGTRVEFKLIEDGKSLTLDNSISLEFDIRWNGAETVTDGEILYLARMWRAGNVGDFLLSKVDANGDLLIYTPNGFEVATLDKDSDDFTSFKVIYYDVTQTYEVWVNGVIKVEGKALTTYSNGSVSLYDADKQIKYTYDQDNLVTREEIFNNDKISLTFCRIFYSDTNATDWNLDLDNVYVREVGADENRREYYSNGFDGADNIYTVIDGSKKFTSSNTYENKNTGGFAIETYTDSNGNTNSYLNLATKAQIRIRDRHQVAQDGGWVVEFDVRATNTNSSRKEKIFHFNDSSPDGADKTAISLGSDGTLYVANNAVTIPGVSIVGANADKDQWTHVAVSVTIDTGNTSTRNTSNWLGASDSSALRYSINVWIDGIYVGSYSDHQRKEMKASSQNEVVFINNVTYERTALTVDEVSALDVSKFTVVSESSTVKKYIDDATGTLYHLAYSNGTPVAGDVTTSTTTATGSVKLTPVSQTYDDRLYFFSNDSASGLSGAIDNIEWYEGVLPKSLAVDESDKIGVVQETEFGYLTTHSSRGKTIRATTNSTYGGEGVAYSYQWKSGSSVANTDSTLNKKYVTFTATGSDLYFDLYTPNVGGKTFAFSTKVRNAKITTDGGVVGLLGIVRQKSDEKTAHNSTLLYVDTTGGVYFLKNGDDYKNYLYDASGNIIKITGSTWTELKAIVDETGAQPYVSYQVNGNKTYFIPEGYDYKLEAVNLSGILSAEVIARKDAISQRLRTMDGAISYTIDALNLKAELVNNPYPYWADSASVDFSKLTSLDELGAQFYYTDGVTLENGVLNVPEGETFAFIDYNNSFYNFTQTNGSYTDGFNAEIKAKTEADGAVLTMESTESRTLITSELVNAIDADRYSKTSATFGANDTNFATYVDGVSRNYETISAVTSVETIAFKVAAGTEVKELYIAPKLSREFAQQSGDIVILDANVSESPVQISGILANNAFNGDTLMTDNDGSKFYRWDYSAKTSNGQRSDWSLTDYVYDRITVFEYDFRMDYPETSAGGSIEMLNFRRIVGYRGAIHWESVLKLTDTGRVNSVIYGNLLNKDGSEIVLTEDWHNVAVIYDGVNGKISYRIDGMVPYVKIDEAVVIAEKIDLPPADTKGVYYHNRLSIDTRVCTLGFGSKFTGVFDLKGMKVYNVDNDNTADIIGAQLDTTEANLRIVGSVDMLYYGDVGFELKVLNTDGTEAMGDWKSYDEDKVYSSILADKVKVYPETYGRRYFFTANIMNVNREHPAKLIVTPYTMVDGAVTYGETYALNVDFTEESMNKWVYEFEKFDRYTSKAEFESIEIGGNQVRIIEGRTDYYRASEGEQYPEIKVTAKGDGTAIEFFDIDDGKGIKLTSADGTDEKVINIHFVKTAALDSYDLDTWLIPYWDGNIVYHETALFGGDSDTATLIYKPEHILSVRSCDLQTEFVEGVDYEVKNGVIYRLPGGRIFNYTDEEFYPASKEESITGRVGELKDGGYILNGPKAEFQQNSIMVTYTHAENTSLYVPEATTKLTNIKSMLEKGEEVNIVFFGDSITAGCNSTGFENVAPYTPKWTDMVNAAIVAKYPDATVNYNNTAVSGWLSHTGLKTVYAQEGIEMKHEDGTDVYEYEYRITNYNPDLLVLAFGMNDGTTLKSARGFANDTKKMIDAVLAKNPDCEILLVSTMLPNTATKTHGTQHLYEDVLFTLANGGAVEDIVSEGYSNVDVMTMTSVSESLLANKDFWDFSSNNTNHPSDFLVRAYAQTALKTLGFDD